MKSLRGFSWLLLVSGTVIGTVIDDAPARTPPRDNGDWMLAADFHVHSFVGDGVLAPWELVREARRRRLDAIAVTNHNQLAGARLTAWLSPRMGGPIIIVGQEVTAIRYHLIALGITHPIDWRQSAAVAIDAIHAQGGAAVAAHPSREAWRGFPEDALRRLDGAEVAHPLIYSEDDGRQDLSDFYRRASARNGNLAPIGSSDFHYSTALGLCRTYVFAREPSERGILDALREGRTVAHDGSRLVSGDPVLVRAAERLLSRESQRSRRSRLMQALTVAAAWVGLLGLVLFGKAAAVTSTYSAC